MGFFSDNPINDAQDHFREQKAIEHETFHCNCCGAQFSSGFGARIEEEKFCGDCMAPACYIPFYQDLGIGDKVIFEFKIIPL